MTTARTTEMLKESKALLRLPDSKASSAQEPDLAAIEKSQHIKKVTFKLIKLSENKPAGAIGLYLDEASEVPADFSFEKGSKAQECSGELLREYNTEVINDWALLQKLFDTLKSNGYNIFYRAKNAIESFSEFQKCIIEEYANYETAKRREEIQYKVKRGRF